MPATRTPSPVAPHGATRQDFRPRSERNMDAKTDDSAGKCPVGTRPRTQATATGGRSSSISGAAFTPPSRRSDEQGFDYAKEFEKPRPRRRDQGPACPDDGFAGMVAGRFRSLRRTVHPDGLAQRRHLPHHRRPWRRRRRPAALRAAQLLAGQRQPRQGAPPAVADQAEVRQQDLLGRPVCSRRQRRPGIDGLQDVRFRRRPRRCVGA